MRRLLVILAALVPASPALAQPPEDPLAEEMVRSLPRGEEVEALAPALDRTLGALLRLDVGPIIDAADPMARRPDHGRPGRTLAEIGRRDDPYFEERLRSGLYGSTADMSRMIDAFAAAAPALARAARDFEAAIGGVVEDYEHRPRPPRYRD